MEEGKNNWYFTPEQLGDTPSRRCGVDAARELSYRQQAANFIQDQGQRLQLSQLCINTAIIYMHRFYMYHSFTEVHRNKIAISALFLSAKVEEQPRKLEHVIKVAHSCLHKDSPNLDTRSEDYIAKVNETVAYENILLQTLGFDIGIEHPHTYVVKVCQLVKASKDLAQTSYIMATTSLHMTTMCLQYKPTIVACVCIHLACKWSSYLIEKCSEGRDWFYYVDKDVTFELLEKLTQEFIEILERSPHRFKKKFCKEVPVTVPKPLDPNQPGPSGVNANDITNHHAIIPIKNNIKKEKDEGKVKKEKEELKIRKEKEEMKTKKEKEEVKIKREEMKIKKDKDPSPGPAIVETNNDYREKKPVINKKEHDGPKREENLYPVVPPMVPTSQHQLPPHPVTHMPIEHLLPPTNQTTIKVSPPEKQQQPPPPPLPQQHLQPPLPPPPPPAVHLPNDHSSSKKSSKEFAESSGGKKHKSKHVSKSKSSSSSNHASSNHTEPSAHGIKVKIRKDIISLSGVDCNQKYAPPVKAETPQKPLKIRLPKPPPESPKVEKTSTPTSLKIVLTKDKFGSGSYSTSHKSEHKESRKRSHGSVVPDGTHREHKNSVEPSNKHQKVEHYQKNHTGDQRPKVSRHSSSHRSDVDKAHNNASSRLQYSNVNDNSTFQNYSAVPGYQNSYLTPPPPVPKLRGHNMMVGKTNSNFPMQPPLPPPQPPPPPPPPEDI